MLGFSSSDPVSIGLITQVEIVEAFLASKFSGHIPHIVGHSLGGVIAWHIAVRKRLSIRSVVLMAPFLGLFSICQQNHFIAVKEQVHPGYPYWLDQLRQYLQCLMFTSPELINKIYSMEWRDWLGSGLNEDGSPQVISMPCLLLWGRVYFYGVRRMIFASRATKTT